MRIGFATIGTPSVSMRSPRETTCGWRNTSGTSRSDPAQWRQPVVDIIPSPTPAEPWRVDLQPKDVVLDDPADGLTEPEPLGSGDPAGTPSEQQQQLCEVYPDIVACMQPGEPEDVELDAEERDVSFTPASGFGAGNASCPADKQMVTSLAGTLSLSWGPACQFATGLRPVVIALAALRDGLNKAHPA